MANETIVLGSGKLYIKEFTNSVPSPTDVCKAENLLGYIQGGASIEYKPTYYTAKDDLGYVTKTIITEEEATLKSGIMTFSGNTLKKICETARVSENSSTHIRTVLIGGAANADGKSYALCFHHEDASDGDKWVMIVGRNQAGFSLSFAKDKETVIDAEFKCEPKLDANGTLIKFVEEYPDNCYIRAFSIGSAVGTIDQIEREIAVEVPHGTALTALVANFTLSSGATAKVGTTNQVSGTTSNNFTNAVTYKITSQDGSKNVNYSVTVTAAAQ